MRKNATAKTIWKNKPLITISRNLNFSKQEYLMGFLVNKLGCKELEITYNYKLKDGTKMFSKWKKITDLWELESNDLVPGTKQTRDEFIKKATHRSVLDIEIMIDIDEEGKYNSIREKAKAIIKKFKENRIVYTNYFSGSKSYHLSIIIPELRELSIIQRTEIKRKFLSSIGADIQKASNRNMIALEGELHWKTGKQKLEVNL